MSKSREHYEIHYRMRHAEADLAYLLDVFGDTLAAKKLVPSELSDIDAVNYYLVRKFNWTPGEVRSMSAEDKRFALTEEMKGFALPREANFTR